MNSASRAEAVQSITYVLHEQARLADLNKPEEQVLCFTEDVVADYYGEPIHGRKAILELLTPALQRWIASSHSITNVQIEVLDAISAHSVSYVHAWHRISETGQDDYEVRGQYHDEWTLTAEGWRISKRTFLTMGASPPRPDAPSIGRRKTLI